MSPTSEANDSAPVAFRADSQALEVLSVFAAGDGKFTAVCKSAATIDINGKTYRLSRDITIIPLKEMPI